MRVYHSTTEPLAFNVRISNLGNQDHVPMALNGAIAVTEIIRLAWLIIGSLSLAVNQWTHLDQRDNEAGTIWAELSANFHPLHRDRALAAEVRDAAQFLERVSTR